MIPHRIICFILFLVLAVNILPFHTIEAHTEDDNLPSNKTVALESQQNSIYPCNLAPSPEYEKACLMSVEWNRRVRKVEKIWILSKLSHELKK